MRRDFSLLRNRQFDLLVVGGGIYGAWTAYDAALRGLKVAIVEQGDWAGATSSASSKLVHGGLRYLESFDFGLVRKSLAERQMLLSTAPHRVWPLCFGVPVYADSRVGMFQMKAGLFLYDSLAEDPVPGMAHRHFDPGPFTARFPFIADNGLKGGFTYGDAQTDDARLVLELISGAMDAGAVCVNYCRLTGWIEEGGRANGATVQDRVGGASAEVRARQLVSATGRWLVASQEGRGWCRLDKGVHLVMPALQTDEALLLTARSDGRVFFMIPWYGMTLLGTTDADYDGDLEHVAPGPEERDYLLVEVRQYLRIAWTEEDVVGSFAGLRVMRHDGGMSPAAASRDWELKTAGNGVHCSVGGKLTSAREDAACIVDTVCGALGVSVPCATRYRDFPWKPDRDFPAWWEENTACALRLGVDAESAKWLLRRHGRRAGQVLRLVEERSELASRIVPGLPFILADLLFCAREEMVIRLPDLLRRRLPLLILARLEKGDLHRLAERIAPELGWDAARIAQEVEACLP